MSSPAVLQDVADRYPVTLTVDQQRIIAAMLDDSYAILLSSDPSIEERLFSSPLLRPLVIQVQASMIIRVLRNPEGKLEETIDDYKYRLDSAVSSGALYVSDAELALLSGAGRRRGAFSIVLSRS